MWVDPRLKIDPKVNEERGLALLCDFPAMRGRERERGSERAFTEASEEEGEKESVEEVTIDLEEGEEAPTSTI